MSIPDPKKDQSTQTGTRTTGASHLEKYTATQKTQEKDTEKSPFYKSQAPAISMPKGGGALKSIDEKFSVNAVNGTASLSIPLPLTPGRGEFTPSLSLQYNSGSGNSEFGLGWALSLPSIQRKTDKGLPRYQDDDSDVFIMSGAEDLQPLLVSTPEGWQADEPATPHYYIKRYRPRIEGLFARIEYIRPHNDRKGWWKVTTKDNIATFYGLTPEARVADPTDATRIFKWLPQISYDAKGNVMQYYYITDTGQLGIPAHLHERNRENGLAPFTNTYLSGVAYCNMLQYNAGDIYCPTLTTPPDTAAGYPANVQYQMQMVFDYGNYDPDAPVPYLSASTWPARKDPFSDFHAGFEIRTYRQCSRALMYHYFHEVFEGDMPDVLDPNVPGALVKSLNFAYYSASVADTFMEGDLLISAMLSGHKWRPDGSYATRSMPAFTMNYLVPEWDTAIQSVSADNIENAPQGLSDKFQLIDLWGEGLPGILTEQAGAWYYKENFGYGSFGNAVKVAEKPSLQGFPDNLQWQDLNGDGRRQLVSRNAALPGYFELDDNQHWQPFSAFSGNINIDWNSPYTKILDLNGDGMPDVLMTDDNLWRWYKNEGTKGYAEGGLWDLLMDEEKSPQLLHNDTVQTIFLADMNGDGLTDIVRISYGEICYWPNMGYGRFGARVTMSNTPAFCDPESFDPKFLTLADISGTGAPDIAYISDNTCTIWLNQAGNAWSAPQQIVLPPMDQYSKISITDICGSGTGCIVWSSPLPQHASQPLRYIDLLRGNKPYLMCSYNNGIGKKTGLSFQSSAIYYVNDKLQGTPWATRLPFPVQCVSSVNVYDTISKADHNQYYTYHHGYYDHEEKEFRGFGRVDVVDAETASAAALSNPDNSSLNQVPVLTRTWYHTGAWMQERTLISAFAQEYYQAEWPELDPEPQIEDTLSPQEWREAYRALKGQPLRQEIYAKDGDLLLGDKPYSVNTYTYAVNRVQPVADNRYGSFYSYRKQSVAYSCERVTEDVRITHEITSLVDEYGNIRESFKIAYPRQTTGLTLPLEVSDAQYAMQIIFSFTNYTEDIIGDAYRLRMPCRSGAYEAIQCSYPGGLWNIDDLNSQVGAASGLDWNESPSTPDEAYVRQISDEITLYFDGHGELPLDVGQHSALGIVHSKYNMALTAGILSDAAYYNGQLTPDMFLDSGYVLERDIAPHYSSDDTRYWIPSGTVVLDAAHFFMPVSYTDPWANETTIEYWGDYWLLPQSITDPIGNVTAVGNYEWCNLQPLTIIDPNQNESHIVYDALGLPIAAAMMEKDGSTTGDTIAGIDPYDTDAHTGFFDDPHANAPDLLQGATWRCIYNWDTLPVSVAMIARERHHSDDPASPVQMRISYTDGMGRMAQYKAQAPAEEGGSDNRWIVNGKTVYNNKGNVVMQYEPFFSQTHDAAFDTQEYIATIGVTPRMYYDPMGRLMRTELPDGSYTKNEWTPWEQTVYDNNDTLAEGVPWYDSRATGALSTVAEETDAKGKALKHADTPTLMYLDTLGRICYTVQHNRYMDFSGAWVDDFYNSATITDISGNRRSVTDARGNTTMTWTYNMVGAPVRQVSMDSGTQVLLGDVAGQVLYTIDADERLFGIQYDYLRRRIGKTVSTGGGTPKTLEQYLYGEDQPSPEALNFRGRLYAVYDGAGRISYDLGYDFKGNPVGSYRQLPTDNTQHPDWSGGTVSLEASVYETKFVYDALDRPVALFSPDGMLVAYHYDMGGNLFDMHTHSTDGVLDTDIINEIYYNARGQRIKVKYENGTTTLYEYDPYTFRVTHILTTRNRDSAILQDLRYWYDPVGNITLQTDDAQQCVYFDGGVAEPTNDYTYDALYRLIRCQGRQHAVSTAASGWRDSPAEDNVLRSDASAMATYIQLYHYDEVGNVQRIRHITGGADSWTRTYVTATDSNRLIKWSVGTTPPTSEVYTYDNRGNIVAGFNHLAHSDALIYNEENRLERTNAGGAEEYYQYDSSGQRVRKYTQYSGGNSEERIYIGQWEVYRRTVSGTLTDVRQTLSAMDSDSRVAVIDTAIVAAHPERPVLRYQYSNHLGSAALELDEDANIISYEEYYPYGSTSFRGGRSIAETSLKRYRYIGKERDGITGFYYMGARYHCPWLARWIAADPINSEMYNHFQGNASRNHDRNYMEITCCTYEYCYANPVRFTDPGGEQATTPIQYVGIPRATTSPAVNATPAQAPKLPWAGAKQASQLKTGSYYKHVPGGWEKAQFSMRGSANTVELEKQGIYTAAGAAKADSTESANIQQAKMIASAEAYSQQAPELQRMQNPVWMAMRFGYESSPIKTGMTAFNEFSQGNYGWGSFYTAAAITPFIIKFSGQAGKLINLYGEGEAPGFMDYAVNPRFATGGNNVTRPLTSTLENGSVAEIVINNSPLFEDELNEINRISTSGTKITMTGPANSKFFETLGNHLGENAVLLDESTATQTFGEVSLEMKTVTYQIK